MKVSAKKHAISLSLALLSLTACTPSMQPPTSQMALAQSAVDKATTAGAYEYAPLELKAAQDKIDMAKTAMQAKQYGEAERLLEQAEIDAQLAEAKSSTAKSQKTVDTLQQGIDLLREEIQRKLQQ
jgi:small-conductance mechanosensitive channel